MDKLHIFRLFANSLLIVAGRGSVHSSDMYAFSWPVGDWFLVVQSCRWDVENSLGFDRSAGSQCLLVSC